MWPVVGGVGNGEAEEDWHWDLNPGAAAMRQLFGTTRLGQRIKQGLLFLFLRYRTPDWTEGDGRTVRLWVF